MPQELRPLVWIDVVGLTPRLLPGARNLAAVAARGSSGPIRGVVPAVTCTAQASALTGLAPSGHGIVGNGWLHRDTAEARFWLQSNALVQGETVYAEARRRAADAQGCDGPHLMIDHGRRDRGVADLQLVLDRGVALRHDVGEFTAECVGRGDRALGEGDWTGGDIRRRAERK